VFSAVDLLGRIGDGDYPDFTGKKVAVIGGGNVAMDCCRTAVRAGAEEVSVVYRRRISDMTALPAEIESAIAEGVEMITLQAPAAIEKDEQGRCCALLTNPQMIGPVKRGRPAPVAADKPPRRCHPDRRGAEHRVRAVRGVRHGCRMGRVQGGRAAACADGRRGACRPRRRCLRGRERVRGR